MSTNPYSAYLESSVLTAAPLQLVHLAYQGTIEAVMRARRHLADGNIPERAQAITKAQLILVELTRSLDLTRGGEVAKQLSSLYDYMLRRLREANFEQKDEPLADVQRLLETLGEAWRELATPETAIATAASASPWATMTESSPRVDFSL